MPHKNVPIFVSRRQIDDCLRSRLQRKLHVTESFVQRLGLEKELEGHQGCVNCLEWNSEGRVLASASDDYRVILWDPFKYRKLHTIQTVHHGNIFSVKFLPFTNDNTLVTGAGDHEVHTLDVTLKETMKVCTCASGRVKRLATTPHLPSLFWSASEDGTVRQYDVRTPHSCSESANILVYLRNHLGLFAEAKCLAVNPMQPEILAVGANDPYVRLYDRRMIRLTQFNSNNQRTRSNSMWGPSDEVEDNLPKDCVQYFVAGHLPVKQKDLQKKFRSLAATYVTFGSKGTDLLLNLGGEHIYLFDITRRQKAKSFDLPKSALPKELSGSSNGYSNGYHNGTNGYTIPPNKKKLPDHIEAIKLTANMLFEKENYGPAIRLYNEAIQLHSNSPILYGNRAAAYMKRNWDGDMYAALRDCHTTLALDPNHVKAFFRLARCLNELHWPDKAKQCLECFKLRFPHHVNSHACLALEKDITHSRMPTADDTGGELDSDEESSPPRDNGFATGHNRIVSRVSWQEWRWRESSYDYDKRFYGHCNTTTDIKEANFFGSDDQYIIAGSDDGSVYLWDRATTNNIRILRGDSSIVNCLQPHPSCCLLATSGIDPLVRLWSPRPEDVENTHEIQDRDSAASSNQRRMKADPLDVVLMNMSYPRFEDDDSTEDDNTPTYNCQAS